MEMLSYKTKMLFGGVCFHCLSMICSVQCVKNRLLCLQSLKLRQCLYVLSVPTGFVLLCSLLVSGPEMQAQRGARRGEAKLQRGAALAAESPWCCRTLAPRMLVLRKTKNRRAGGKDRMCWPVWQEVGLAGLDNESVLEAEARFLNMNWRAHMCPPFLKCWAHIALMAVAKALALWKGVRRNSLAKTWLAARTGESKVSPWRGFGPAHCTCDKLRNPWQNYPAGK